MRKTLRHSKWEMSNREQRLIPLVINSSETAPFASIADFCEAVVKFKSVSYVRIDDDFIRNVDTTDLDRMIRTCARLPRLRALVILRSRDELWGPHKVITRNKCF